MLARRRRRRSNINPALGLDASTLDSVRDGQHIMSVKKAVFLYAGDSVRLYQQFHEKM